MALSRRQFERAAAAEQRQLRVERLLSMGYGELYTLLTGDSAQAAEWIRSAAEFGIAAAQLRLGRMLLEGMLLESGAVPRNHAQALYWFERASDQGCAEAMNMVGRCHENGWGTSMDLIVAAREYGRSARLGHDWGQYNFGNMLFDGRGIERDQTVAVEWYERAARQGHSRAMNLLARCAEQGWGRTRDAATAAMWYQRSAQLGYFRAQFNYALVLLERDQHQEAAAWFTEAAAGRDQNVLQAIARVLGRTTHPALCAARRLAQRYLA